MYDLIIVGAGPCGIAAAVEAQRQGLSYLVLEQGSVCMSLTKYPIYMTFASSPENLELGGHPFPTAGEKPTRLEAIRYFRRVAEVEGINVHQYEKVVAVRPMADGYQVQTSRRDGTSESYAARNIALAIGYFDHPNMLGIPGEEDPERCTHFYTEPSPYYGMEVAVVGGKNSAVEAALQLHRAGCKVSLIYRRAELSSSVKPWVRPDIESRIKSGAITAYFETNILAINPTSITLERAGERFELKNDFVFALTGYSPDQTVLRRLGVTIDEETGKPFHDEATMETNVQGLFLIGVIAAGYEANKIFIENGRFHGKAVVETILARRKGEVGGRPRSAQALAHLCYDRAEYRLRALGVSLMADFSFDIVSRVEMAEVVNAVNQASKEMAGRFDFRGSKASIALDEKKAELTLIGDDELKLRNVVEILESKLIKRGVSIKALDYSKPEPAAGSTLRQVVKLTQGIAQDKAKQITGAIKDAKLKVKAEIRGEEIRVAGAKKDDLQAVISLLRSKDFGIELQFTNYR